MSEKRKKEGKDIVTSTYQVKTELAGCLTVAVSLLPPSPSHQTFLPIAFHVSLR